MRVSKSYLTEVPQIALPPIVKEVYVADPTLPPILELILSRLSALENKPQEPTTVEALEKIDLSEIISRLSNLETLAKKPRPNYEFNVSRDANGLVAKIIAIIRK